jgi:hypothetical protein
MKKHSISQSFWVMALVLWVLQATPSEAYTANQVSFEFLSSGTYRVNLYYTVPALREFREAQIEFTDRRQAEKFYFDVAKGGDFYVNGSGEVEFKNGQLSPSPW